MGAVRKKRMPEDAIISNRKGARCPPWRHGARLVPALFVLAAIRLVAMPPASAQEARDTTGAAPESSARAPARIGAVVGWMAASSASRAAQEEPAAENDDGRASSAAASPSAAASTPVPPPTKETPSHAPAADASAGAGRPAVGAPPGDAASPTAPVHERKMRRTPAAAVPPRPRPIPARDPRACTPQREGLTACFANRLCRCGYAPPDKGRGLPGRWRWDCGILRPACRLPAAETRDAVPYGAEIPPPVIVDLDTGAPRGEPPADPDEPHRRR